jgi:phosphate transport system protein
MAVAAVPDVNLLEEWPMPPPSEHTLKQFDADLEAIRSKVLQMGGLVELQIRNSIRGLTTGDVDAEEEVIQNDRQVNTFEVEIDEACAQIIARRQPAAGDLRSVMSISKTVTDLERMGDEAKKIARIAKQISARGQLQVPRLADVTHAADAALDLLRRALDSYARLDSHTAQQLIREDAVIDTEFRAILRQLITYMMEDPRTIGSAMDIIWIAKAIERIGDHSKNIAEQVVFIVEGTDIRHTTHARAPGGT